MKVYGDRMSSPCVRWGVPRAPAQRHAGWVQILALPYPAMRCWPLICRLGGRPSWGCTEESCEALRTVPGTQIANDVTHGEHTTHLQKAHIWKDVVFPRQIRNQPITHNRVPIVSQALCHVLGHSGEYQQHTPVLQELRSCLNPLWREIPVPAAWTVLQAGARATG